MSRPDYQDIIGKEFGRLTPVEYLGKIKIRNWKNATHAYRCKCSCGKEIIVTRSHLTSGAQRSCGCLGTGPLKNKDYSDLIGKRFGKIVVEKYLGIDTTENSKRRQSFYLCKCDCGNEVKIPRHTLMSGSINCCGNCQKIVKEGDHYRCYCENGKSWIFDDVDLKFVESHKWHISNRGYVDTYVHGYTQKSFHQLLFNPPQGYYVDHIDGNPSNNRRANLRLITPRQNTQNKVIEPYNSTGYKGVVYYPNKKSHWYRAYIVHNGKRIDLGYYDTAEEAARAYDEGARFYFGEFACVNFPREGEQCCFRNQKRKANVPVWAEDLDVPPYDGPGLFWAEIFGNIMPIPEFMPESAESIIPVGIKPSVQEVIGA